METKDRLWGVCKEIYRELFKHAEPPADFDKLIESGEAKKPMFFWDYYMPQDDQDKIIDGVCEKHKLIEWEKEVVSTEVNLGCSPSCVKQDERR